MNNPFLVFTGMGFELIGLILVGVYSGAWLDKHNFLNQFGVPVMVLSALVIWMIHIIWLLQRINKKD